MLCYFFGRVPSEVRNKIYEHILFDATAQYGRFMSTLTRAPKKGGGRFNDLYCYTRLSRDCRLLQGHALACPVPRQRNRSRPGVRVKDNCIPSTEPRAERLSGYRIVELFDA